MPNVKQSTTEEPTIVEEKKIVKKGRKPAKKSEQALQKQTDRLAAELHGNTRPYERDTTCGQSEISAILQLYNLPPIDLDNEDAVRRRVGEYFQWVDVHGAFPSLSSLALALGVDRKTLMSWGTAFRKDSDHIRIVKQAKSVITALTEQMGANGSIAPIYAMFLLNNSNEGFVNSNRVELAQATTEQLDAPKMADVIDIYDIPETEDNGKR